jgi:hypothetical protein
MAALDGRDGGGRLRSLWTELEVSGLLVVPLNVG